MAKIKFPDKEFKELEKLDAGLEPQGGVKSKISGFSGRIFSIVKLLLGICLLVLVYSFSRAFLNEFVIIDKPLQDSFLAGLVTFILIYLFIYEPAALYRKGQELLQVIFKFFTPLVKVAPYLLPVYTIIIFLAYLLFSLFNRSNQGLPYFIFLFGFTLALHLVFSAKSLRSRQGDFLKANYIFGFSFLYIVNIIIVALFFSSIFEKFSVVNFFNNSFQAAKDIFNAVFKQLFL